MKKKLLAIALSTIGAVGAVQAGAVAQSSLQILNLTLSNAATGVTLNAAQFDLLQITDTTNLNPTVTPGGANPFANASAMGAPLPLTVVCFPVACPAALLPGTPFANATTPATVNGALAASELVNAPITGLATPYNGGVDARTNSVAERISTGSASTTSALDLAVQFSFSLQNDLAVGINFDAIAHLLAFLDSQTSATTGLTWTANLVNHDTGAQIFSWSPNGGVGGISGIAGTAELLDPCTLNRTLGALGPTANFSYDCSGAFAARTGVLLAANTYDFSINHQNNASVVVHRVPEPSMLSLLGLALAGIGFTTRRKSKA